MRHLKDEVVQFFVGLLAACLVVRLMSASDVLGLNLSGGLASGLATCASVCLCLLMVMAVLSAEVESMLACMLLGLVCTSLVTGDPRTVMVWALLAGTVSGLFYWLRSVREGAPSSASAAPARR